MMTYLRTITALLLAGSIAGCGALLSETPEDEEVFDAPIDGLTPTQMSTFLAGDEAFGEHLTAATGLGPVFNQPACITCHPNEGRGHPSTNLVRFGRGDSSDASTFDYLTKLGGPQLQDHAIPGYQPEQLPSGVAQSRRGGPIAVGLGLLEAVPAKVILELADPGDKDGDGIRGVPNYVPAPSYVSTDGCSCDGCIKGASGCAMLGRFGRKATAVNLLQQTAAAYLNDMGITSDFETAEVFNPLVGGPSGDSVPDPEVSSDTVRNVVFYLQTLRQPLRRNADDPEVSRGEKLFSTIGCASCHRPSMTTGPSPIEALANKRIHPYSDLLLHDLGSALADGYPEGRANGRQWRTTPLWGLGIIAGQLGGQTFYLHDGRARTLSAAIELHGGEAKRSSEGFAKLSSADREALLAFLRSL